MTFLNILSRVIFGRETSPGLFPVAGARLLPSALAVLCLLQPDLLASQVLHVAPGGSDESPGTPDKPLATWHAAQQAVRTLRKTAPDAPVTVLFEDGTYALDAPLLFTPEDSGAGADAPVRYAAAPGARPVFTGGLRITDWKPDPERPGVWMARVPSNPKDGSSWNFGQLWVNGQRAVRARTPNVSKFHRLKAVREDALSESDRVRHTFELEPEAIESLARLSKDALSGVELLIYHKWDTTRERLTGLDASSNSVISHGSAMKSWNPMTPGNLFVLENYLEALDAPGEWFLDRDGWLRYFPQPGEALQTAEVVAPRIHGFLRLEGTARDRVRHITFEGLTFRHAEFTLPQEGLPPSQAAMNVFEAAVLLDGVRHILLKKCAVEHIGSTAVWFRKACLDSRLEHCRLFDLGITGVRIGETRLVPEEARTGGITVENCIVHSGGRITPHAVGIWIGHSADNAILHCDVADFTYTAISAGWRWGYEESGAKRNRIEFNHLHHIGYRILSDMGGIYTLGPSEGTRIRHNHIHHVYSSTYGGWGLYPDEGSTGILFENNLVHDVKDGGFHQHYGRENIVRNNIFAFSEEGQVAVTRSEPHLSFTFEKNIVYWDSGRLLGYGGWNAGARVELRNNLYWRAGGQPFDFAGVPWSEWQASGRDSGSRIADPLFVDAAGRDFRLRPESPALELGFQPFDLTAPGVRGDPDWIALARSTRFPAPHKP